MFSKPVGLNYEQKISQTAKTHVIVCMKDDFIPLALNSNELRARLGGISRSTLYRLIKQKVFTPLPHMKRNRLFSYQSIVEFLQPPKKK